MSTKEINEMRKQGHLDEALAAAEQEFAVNPSKFEASALFWCLNDELKTKINQDETQAIIDRMDMLCSQYEPDNEIMRKVLAVAHRMLTPEGRSESQGWEIYHTLRQLDFKEVDYRKRLLFEYLKLQLPSPSLLHSLIMSEAVKMEKCTAAQFLFSKFADMWGLDQLRDEDWEQPTSKDGHRFSSLAEKIIGAYVKEMNADGVLPSPQFRDLLNRAIATYPTNLHLPRYAAQIMAHDGDVAGALEKFKTLIIKNPDKFYLWDDMAQLATDPDLAMGFMSGALLTNALDEFTVNIRMRLADMLCDRQYYGEAKAELDAIQRVYEYKRWPLKRRYYSILNRLPQNTQAIDPRRLHLHLRDAAEQFIYSSLPSHTMVKVWEKRDMIDGKPVISWLLRCDQDEIWIKPKRFRLDFHTPNGTVFDVKTIDARSNGNAQPTKLVAWIAPKDLEQDLPWLRHVTAPLEIRRQPGDKIFGFVEQAFVPSHLLYGRNQGTPTTALAVLNGDRWQAITLK